MDFRGEGDSFGAVSLLKGGNAMFDVTAEEDLIVFLIPKAGIEALMAATAIFSAISVSPWPATLRRFAKRSTTS